MGVMNPKRGDYIGHRVYVIRSTTGVQLANNGSSQNIRNSEDKDAARKKDVSHVIIAETSLSVNPQFLLTTLEGFH